MPGKVIHVTDTKHFETILAENKDKLVAVDFSATWCGPCKMIGPKFEAASEKYPGVVFAKVDIDECGDLADKKSISGVPTFHFYKGGNLLEEFSGAYKTTFRASLSLPQLFTPFLS